MGKGHFSIPSSYLLETVVQLNRCPPSLFGCILLLTSTISASYCSPCCLHAGDASCRLLLVAQWGSGAGQSRPRCRRPCTSPLLILPGVGPSHGPSGFVFCPRWVCVPSETLDPGRSTLSHKEKKKKRKKESNREILDQG